MLIREGKVAVAAAEGSPESRRVNCSWAGGGQRHLGRPAARAEADAQYFLAIDWARRRDEEIERVRTRD
jgi:hypothetical protein